jgi:hypothetical protein
VPTKPHLTADTLNDALSELGLLARSEGKVIEVAIYGGSALLLASNFRVVTRDVDAVADDEGQRDIERMAAVVAIRRGWSADWLNDQVFPFLSEAVAGLDQHHALLRSYPCEQEPGLRIFVPTPEYLLAMKLTAMRIGGAHGDKDRDDIVNLMDIVGLTSKEDALAFVAEFYPEARVSQRVTSGLDELFGMKIVPREEEPDVAPTYLGRGRATR